MDRKKVLLFSLLSFFAFLTACNSSEAQGSSYSSDQFEFPTSSPNPFPLGCQPDEILLDNLQAQLPYDQTEILYQSYAGEQALVVWLVEPFLGTAYTAENERLALEAAVNAAQILDEASVCVSKFGLLHITVVSADYTRWFSGAINPADIDGAEEVSSGGSPEGERGSGVAPATAAAPELSRNSDCDLPTTRDALEGLALESGFSLGSYYVRDDNGANLFIHWVLPEEISAVDSLSFLDLVLPTVSCLYPRPSGLSITAAGADGVILLSGYLPGSSGRRSTEFDLGSLTYQLLDGQ